jgi:hypothetical protein
MRNMKYTGRPSLKWLFEQDEKPEATGGEAGAAPDPGLANQIAELWKLPYAAFVEKLKTVAKDPKLRAFLAAGRKDGEPGDEGVTVASKTIAGSALSPTQSEIDLGSSVAYTFKNPGSIAAFYSGPWKGGDPIITAGGKWVIDGHHRWSSAMVFNPNVQLLCIDIGISDPEMALKMTQAAIATTKGNLPTQAVKPGMNIYNMSFDDIINKFGTGATTLTLDVVKELQNRLVISATPQEIAKADASPTKPTTNVTNKQLIAAGGNQMGGGGMNAYAEMQQALGEQAGFASLANIGNLANVSDTGNTGDVVPPGDPAAQWGKAAASLAHNCKTLAAAGQFPRPIMPQTGTGDGGPGPEELGKELQSGDINSKPGYDVVKEGVSFDLNRWQVLAGIKRRG